ARPAQDPDVGSSGQGSAAAAPWPGGGAFATGPFTAAGPVPGGRDAVVALTVSGGTVSGVAISGRPSHPFSGTEGSHTTAWAVYGDAVRRSVVGHPPNVAAANLLHLAGNLGDGSTLQDTGSTLYEQRRSRFLTARQRVYDALGRIGQPGENPARALQDAVTAYLTARNLAPLAGVNFGAAQAVGSGEAQARDMLRQHETGQVALGGQELREAIWTLLDVQTLTRMPDLPQ